MTSACREQTGQGWRAHTGHGVTRGVSLRDENKSEDVTYNEMHAATSATRSYTRNRDRYIHTDDERESGKFKFGNSRRRSRASGATLRSDDSWTPNVEDGSYTTRRCKICGSSIRICVEPVVASIHSCVRAQYNSLGPSPMFTLKSIGRTLQLEHPSIFCA